MKLMQQAAVPERQNLWPDAARVGSSGCIVEGCSNRDIAKQFSISEETVKRHLSNIFDKNGSFHASGTGVVCHSPPVGGTANLTPDTSSASSSAKHGYALAPAVLQVCICNECG